MLSDQSLSRVRDLKFKQLLVFERVATLGSMHKAAEAVHMTQPNVVKIVRQLEELLEVTLFERHSKGVRLTVFAEHLLERIRPMLGDARALSEELEALRSGEGGQVAVGTLISASAWLLPESVALMKRRHPKVGLTIQEATNDILFPMLRVGELDVIVGRLPESPGEGVEAHAIYDDELMIVARASHPLSRRPDCAPGDLLDYPWIVPSNASPVRRQVDRFFRGHALPIPHNQIVSLSMLTNLGILARSDTLAMLPSVAARPLIHAGVLFEVPIHVRVPFGTIGYSLRADREPVPAAALFIGILKEVGARAQGTGVLRGAAD
ncbi:Transcriptional regulator, LysR family OS=Castellaniella defragrans (strain DSM / CCUG 39792/ 65Phen) OX=1437824 GN=BN940_01111 PE=3 SV=1 [Castellaniella denitrificans]|uniref:LysR substrate-binding domain-containing protein n=1 Tax=Castellaniella sp. TaxID=1955812 RepID=UPI002AFE1AF2|nr:LysR substrate-binding domain-containing protein [Castellaniella sp.]